MTIGDTEAGVTKLCDALVASFANRRGEPRPPGAASAVWDVAPETAMTPREAFFAPRETVAAESAGGRVAAEMVAPYPPGIPAIAPASRLPGARRRAAEAAAGRHPALLLRRSRRSARSRSSPRRPNRPNPRRTAALRGLLGDLL